jgi:hypothetical protein
MPKVESTFCWLLILIGTDEVVIDIVAYPIYPEQLPVGAKADHNLA